MGKKMYVGMEKGKNHRQQVVGRAQFAMGKA